MTSADTVRFAGRGMMDMVKYMVMVSLAIALAAPSRGDAQQHIAQRRALDVNASLKIYNPAGSVRLVAWDKDSVTVEGTVGKGEQFYFSGTERGAKLGIVDPTIPRPVEPSDLVVFVPRGSRLGVKTVTASIEGTSVSGWFNTVSGTIRLRGQSREVDATAMDGAVIVEVTGPYVRAKTGGGVLTLGGVVDDIAGTTVDGYMAITTSGLGRAKFESVTGKIYFTGDLSRASTVDFDDHSGAVELVIPPKVAADFDLTTIEGDIDNRLTAARAIATRNGKARELGFTTGDGGARVIVRTYKGVIRLRNQ